MTKFSIGLAAVAATMMTAARPRGGAHVEPDGRRCGDVSDEDHRRERGQFEGPHVDTVLMP